MAQNTSSAVMAQRIEPADSLDYFPSPPWATRAFVEHVLGSSLLGNKIVDEPCCGEGHMAIPLAEYAGQVRSSDIFDYGFGSVCDFAQVSEFHQIRPDWVITNPPFTRFAEFAQHAMTWATEGVAMIARNTILESGGRYKSMYQHRMPNREALYVERVPMLKGRYDPKASTATAYVWLIWERNQTTGEWGVPMWQTRKGLIPPCRKALERLPSDALIGKPFAPRPKDKPLL